MASSAFSAIKQGVATYKEAKNVAGDVKKIGNDLLLLLFGWVWPKHSSDLVDDLLNVTGSILNVLVCGNALLDSAECTRSHKQDADWVHILQTKDLCKE